MNNKQDTNLIFTQNLISVTKVKFARLLYRNTDIDMLSVKIHMHGFLSNGEL